MYQPHSSHKLKAYSGDVGKRTVFCSECGKEDTEIAITEPCPGEFYCKGVDKDMERK